MLGLVFFAITISQAGVVAGVQSKRGYNLFRPHYFEIVDASKACSCDCCISELRRPSEVDGDVTWKCATMTPQDERRTRFGCSEECAVVNDIVLDVAHTITQEQFCFYHCKPGVNHGSLLTSGGGSTVNALCSDLTAEELEQAAIADLNGRDAELQGSASVENDT
mmetsp:Transcript_8536/g.15256  ORF Transcript_8536/g.15256 Transcript_8536/m.15256 type:complete len:165 (-) Transcript_8536:68-562(-)